MSSLYFLDYAAAGGMGIALGIDLFPRFLRRFIKFQYVRMLKEDERERRRDLITELRGFHPRRPHQGVQRTCFPTLGQGSPQICSSTQSHPMESPVRGDVAAAG